jgi:DNA-binding response OmpR family regulator
MTYKIMIVDDEPEILQALETFLSLRGYQVSTSEDPWAALERIEFEKFHVVLLDINMPQMSGIELLRRIKCARPTVQVIMMTAYTTIQKTIECIENGAGDYVLKPFSDMEEFASIVRMSCERIARWEVVARESLRNPRDVSVHQI